MKTDPYGTSGHFFTISYRIILLIYRFKHIKKGFCSFTTFEVMPIPNYPFMQIYKGEGGIDNMQILWLDRFTELH